jgi:Protein of unknown function (DUF1566)
VVAACVVVGCGGDGSIPGGASGTPNTSGMAGMDTIGANGTGAMTGGAGPTGTGGMTGVAGADGTSGSNGGGHAAGSLNTGGGGTNANAGGAGGGSAAGGCAPAIGIEYSYACWPMPNPSSAGLPNPASYTDVADGTVKDNVTGLVWQKVVTAQQAYSWVDAQAYCAGLTLAGRGWRLPTRIELLSIVDFTRTSPAIDTKTFPGTPGGKYHWTSSPWVVSQIATKPQYSWIVNFYEGLTSNAGDRTQLEYARCVSSSVHGPLPKLYTQPAPGEIEDAETKLVWQQADSGSPMAFDAAAPHCQSLALNAHVWRVPSIKELSTLVDETPPITKVSPAIDTTTFPSTPANAPYWSSSLFDGQAATVHSPWVINYLDGFTQYNQTTARVRCVR